MLPSVTPCTLAVRRPLVPLTLSRALPVGPSLPRGFPGGPAAADGAASAFKRLVLVARGEHSSSVVWSRAGSSEKCTGAWAGVAERCGSIYLNAVLDEDTVLLSVEDSDFGHAIRFYVAMAELGSCLAGSWVAADGTRVSAGCLEETMNLELSRSVGSTEVSPFIDQSW